VGSIVELGDVLFLSGSGNVKIGTPLVDGARVIAEVMEHGRDKKISVFKYKNKTRYRRRRGHRQDYTRLAIRGILAAGEEALAGEEAKPKRPARKRPAAKDTVAALTVAEVKETAGADVQAATIEDKSKRPARKRPASKATVAAVVGEVEETAGAEIQTATAEAKPKPKPRAARRAAKTAETATETQSATRRKKPAIAETSGE